MAMNNHLLIVPAECGRPSSMWMTDPPEGPYGMADRASDRTAGHRRTLSGASLTSPKTTDRNCAQKKKKIYQTGIRFALNQRTDSRFLDVNVPCNPTQVELRIGLDGYWTRCTKSGGPYSVSYIGS